SLVDQQFRIAISEARKFPSNSVALADVKDFIADFTFLRSVEAGPDANHLHLRAPKGEVLLHIAGSGSHGTGDRPMNVHTSAGHVAQDGLVGGRFTAADSVLRQSVDGDGDSYARDRHPVWWDRDHGARYDHGVNSHAAQNRQDATEFTMKNPGLPADQGNVQWPMPSHKRNHSIH